MESQTVNIIYRYDKRLNYKIDISCPKIVQEYDVHMDGVDLMNSHLGRFRITVKSRKWCLRLFYHLLDVAVINSSTAKGIPNKKLPDIGQFRNDLADARCNVATHINGNKRS